MSDFGKDLKGLFSRGLEAIGNTASNIAASVYTKADAMNLASQRDQLIRELGCETYDAFLRGENLPEGLKDILKDLQDLDQKIDEMNKRNPTAELQEAPENESAGTENETYEEPDKNPEEYAGEKAPVIEVKESEEESFPQMETPVINTTEGDPGTGEDDITPLSRMINHLFEKIPDMNTVTEKVNTVLDDLGENLKKVGSELDKEISELSDKLHGDHQDRE